MSAPAIIAVKQATSVIPVVFAATSDPVRSGFVSSLARSGGNLTGLSLMAPELAAKRLELLKSVAPAASRVVMLWNASDEGMAIRVKEAELAAPALHVTPSFHRNCGSQTISITCSLLSHGPPRTPF
jgi:putative ABC transport system substrate-binding protein